MAAIPYRDKVKDLILDALVDRPLTVSELSDQLGLPYTTVQQAHKALKDEDRILRYDRRMRNSRWTVGANNGPKSIVPSIRIGSDTVKYTDVRQRYVDFHNPNSVPQGMANIVLNVFSTWATIARTAEHLHKGLPENAILKRLESKKAELVRARAAFENMAFICSQMLEQPKLWDTNYLSQFPDDKDWDEFRPHLVQMLEFINSANKEEKE